MSAPDIDRRPAGAAGAARDARVVVQFQRLDALLILAQAGDRGVGFQRLSASDAMRTC